MLHIELSTGKVVKFSAHDPIADLRAALEEVPTPKLPIAHLTFEGNDTIFVTHIVRMWET